MIVWFFFVIFGIFSSFEAKPEWEVCGALEGFMSKFIWAGSWNPPQIAIFFYTFINKTPKVYCYMFTSEKTCFISQKYDKNQPSFDSAFLKIERIF